MLVARIKSIFFIIEALLTTPIHVCVCTDDSSLKFEDDMINKCLALYHLLTLETLT